jgi:hypothetical protein
MTGCTSRDNKLYKHHLLYVVNIYVLVLVLNSVKDMISCVHMYPTTNLVGYIYIVREWKYNITNLGVGVIDIFQDMIN